MLLPMTKRDLYPDLWGKRILKQMDNDKQRSTFVNV